MDAQGKLQARWINPATGEQLAVEPFDDRRRVFHPPQEWKDAILHVTQAHGK
jgi:hypothetical protein